MVLKEYVEKIENDRLLYTEIENEVLRHTFRYFFVKQGICTPTEFNEVLSEMKEDIIFSRYNKERKEK